MQVSWIDPEELRTLASKLLEQQKSETAPIAWELHTLPDFSPVMPGGIFDSAPSPVVRSAPAFAMPQSAPPLAPDIANIREKLRAIRDRAQDAGLLPPPAPPAAPPAEPERQPDPQPMAVSFAPAPAESHAVTAPFAPQAPQTPAVPLTGFLPLEGNIAERLDSFVRWAIQLTNAQEVILVDDHGDSLWGALSRNDLVISAMLALNANLRSSASEISNPSRVVRSKAGPEHELSIMPCSTHYGMVSLAIVSAQPLSDEVVACLREALILAIDGARVV